MKGIRQVFKRAISSIGAFSPSAAVEMTDDKRRLAKVLLGNTKKWRRVDDKADGECAGFIRVLEGVVGT
jgi:hypothetical protein